MTFSPTHRVPASGLATYAQPDPTLPPGPWLDPGLEVEVLEARPEGWAHVACSNGWTAWVDGRLLAARGAATAEPAPPAASVPVAPAPAVATRAAPVPGASVPVAPARPVPLGALRSPALLGALGLYVAMALPWLRVKGVGARHSFDVPLKFLLDSKKAGESAFEVGTLLLVVALAGLVAAVVPRARAWRPWCGGAAVAIAVLYAVQVQRLLSTAPAATRPGLASTVGIGVWLTVAAGIALALDRKPAPGS